MIVGSGLLAKAFARTSLPRSILVIARGVANSKEVNPEQFQRERDSIYELGRKKTHERWIYFSTCSIEHGISSPYVEHKLQMEELVCSLCDSVCIVRLPQVVGIVNNNTLVSYLTRRMFLGLPVSVQRSAIRRLIDVEDVVKAVQCVLDCSDAARGLLLSVAPVNGVSVFSIANQIKSIIASSSEINVVDGGDDQVVTRNGDLSNLPVFDLIDAADYPKVVIEKYVPQLLTRYGDLWSVEKPR